MNPTYTPGATILLLMMFAACSSRELPPEDYRQWVEDVHNGLRCLREADGVVYDLQFMPPAYRSLIHGGYMAPPEDSLQYFLLMLKTATADNRFTSELVTQEQQQAAYYFAYRFQNDLTLNDGEQNLPCVLFHEENTGTNGQRRFLLGFAHRNKRNNVSLTVASPLLGGIVELVIDKSSIPTLIIH